MLALIGRIAAALALLTAIGIELAVVRYGISKRKLSTARRLLGRRIQ